MLVNSALAVSDLFFVFSFKTQALSRFVSMDQFAFILTLPTLWSVCICIHAHITYIWICWKNYLMQCNQTCIYM